jgi:hypothetical protein
MASLIVLSYHSWSPGELSQKWKVTHQTFATKIFHWFAPSGSSRSRVRRYTLSAVVVTLLQQLGSVSPTLQRLILHVVQPVVFGGIFLLGYLMAEHPLSFIGAGVVLLGIIFLIYRAIAEDRSERDDEGDANLMIFPDNSLNSAEVPGEQKVEGSNKVVLSDEIEVEEGGIAQSLLSLPNRVRAYSSEVEQEDRDSLDRESSCSRSNSGGSETLHRRQLSSSSEDFTIGSSRVRQARGDSVGSTNSSLSDRLRGSSFDWNGREMIWSDSPQVTEEFHVLDHLSKDDGCEIQIRCVEGIMDREAGEGSRRTNSR